MGADLFQYLRVHQGRRGFSLFELLVVIALVGIMVGVATMSLAGLRSTTLSTSTRQMTDFINVCRSRAIAQHTTIRVGVAVDTRAGGAATHERQVKLYSSWAWNKKTRTFEQLDAWKLLPGDLTFESRVVDYIRKSDYAQKDPAAIRGRHVLAEASPDPMEVDGQTIRFIQFSPTGRASVDGSEERNLILIIRSGSVQTEFEGANWAQLNIDTLTGRVRIYRP